MTRRYCPLTAADYRRDESRSRPSCDVYLVKSRSEPGKERTVIHTRRPESWGCDCPATKRCAHIELIAYEEAARPWRDHWRLAPDLSLVLTDREFALRPGELTDDERMQWDTLGDELARRALSPESVSAHTAPVGLAERRAAGRKAVADLFGGN